MKINLFSVSILSFEATIFSALSHQRPALSCDVLGFQGHIFVGLHRLPVPLCN